MDTNQKKKNLVEQIEKLNQCIVVVKYSTIIILLIVLLMHIHSLINFHKIAKIWYFFVPMGTFIIWLDLKKRREKLLIIDEEKMEAHRR